MTKPANRDIDQQIEPVAPSSTAAGHSSTVKLTAPAPAEQEGRAMTEIGGDRSRSLGAQQVRSVIDCRCPLGRRGVVGKTASMVHRGRRGTLPQPRHYIHGQESSKALAIALAEEIIRDGRMPAPEEASDAAPSGANGDATPVCEATARGEQARGRPPSSDVPLEYREEEEAPFYELMADAFDLSDPGLWKSNSFSLLRPRLVVSVEAAIAGFEYEIVHLQRTKTQRRFTLFGKGTKTSRRRDHDERQIATFEQKLARARDILRLLTECAP